MNFESTLSASLEPTDLRGEAMDLGQVFLVKRSADGAGWLSV